LAPALILKGLHNYSIRSQLTLSDPDGVASGAAFGYKHPTLKGSIKLRDDSCI
jgi:hypothetical protein